MEQEYEQVAKTSGQRSSWRPFHQKANYLAADLKKWRRAKPQLADQLAMVEDQLLQDQLKPPNQQDFQLQQQLTEQHHQLLLKDEEFHHQRAKNWAVKGDQNTAYFHQAIVKRNRKNRITYLCNPDGSESTTPEQIADTLTAYFKDIFSSQSTSTQHTDSHHVFHMSAHHSNTGAPTSATFGTTFPGQPIDQPELTAFTNSQPTIQELHDIIKQMRNNASPRPDGLNATFYKSAWSWLGQDVYKLVTDFYTTAFMQPEINQTFIVLIPKKIQPIIPQDFRPISLSNVIYKIIAKSLADRLKPYLTNFVDNAQAAFIKNRHISSNIIISREIIHSFHLKTWRHNAFLLKIDLAKAFDRLNWNFIKGALTRLGLHCHFISLIHACMSSASFSILVNGEPTDYFRSQRGIRQGCPCHHTSLLWLLMNYQFNYSNNCSKLTLQG